MSICHLERFNTVPKEYEEILYRGISEDAFEVKGMPPIKGYSVFMKDSEGRVKGGVSGSIFFGSLYIDSLWVEKAFRGLGWGTKLMQEAEKIGVEHGCRFATLNTMDWEALPFYQKLGYSIEFVREGYDKSSKMFMLRKTLYLAK